MVKPKVPKLGSADSWGSLTTAQGPWLHPGQLTFVPEIHFSEIMKINSGLTMNRTASYAIAAVIQVLTFFFGGQPHFLLYSYFNIIIGIESGAKSSVTYNWGTQKSRFTKRSPRSSRFAKKGSVRQKVREPLV